ncbi:hypothetical protein HYX19_04835 [Candidatus Woesearchaeota archaeon]|nr:hypothetical protein [Candidatus Woesearchaeota archaeon]
MVFKVELENTELEFFNAFKSEGIGRLGYTPLPEGPLMNLDIAESSNGSYYILKAGIIQDTTKYMEEEREFQKKAIMYKISLSDYERKVKEYAKKGKKIDFGEPPVIDFKEPEPPKNINIPIKNLETVFGKERIKSVRKVVFLLDDKAEIEYEIYNGAATNYGVENGLTLSCGDNMTAPPKKLTTQDNLIKDLKRFSKILETLVNGIYEENNTKIDLKFYLRVPFGIGEDKAIIDSNSVKEKKPYDGRGPYL